MNVNRSHPAGEGGEGHEQMEVGGLMKRDALGNGEPPTLNVRCGEYHKDMRRIPSRGEATEGRGSWNDEWIV